MRPTPIEGSIALVTGANRGIGRAIVERLLARGAARVYATGRDLNALPDFGERCERLALDVTDPAQVRAAADSIERLSLLVNNAGVVAGFDLLGADAVEKARMEMEVNYLGALRMTHAFADKLAGGAIANLGSVSSLSAFPGFPTYSATKAAVHSLTQSSRLVLGARDVSVSGVYPGPVDTEMTRSLEMDKATPESVADATLDGIERGDEEIFPDPFAVAFGQAYLASPKAAEQQVAKMVAEA